MADSPTPAIARLPLETFLADLSAKTPAPGGGAAACASGAIAAALGGMVVAYSVGKKDLAAHRGLLESVGERLARGRAMLLQLADEDAAAYAWLNTLQKLPAGDAKRAREEPAAAAACVQIPLSAMAVCVEVLAALGELIGTSNPHLRSDLIASAILAEGACRAGRENVRVNLPLLAPVEREQALREMDHLAESAAATLARVAG